MTDYLHIIKTKSYQNDSRLLKWVDSLNKYKLQSSVFVLEDKNAAGQVQNKNAANVIATALLARRFFKKGKGFIFKIPEFSSKCLKYIRKSDAKVVVFHDLQHYLTLLLLCMKKPKDKKIIWDLHELFHESLLKFAVSRKILEYILSRVDCIVYTNNYRREYTLKKLNYSETKYIILNNFTDSSYKDSKRRELPTDLKDWLNEKKYIIWLGAGLKARNFLPFLKAYKKLIEKYRLVMLGRPDEQATDFIKKNKLSEYIYSTFVKPEEIINYIDHAEFSVVLYKHNSSNNFYCEPNRLYQLTARGVPVIVGNNPQMANLINENKAGIVLEDDGTNVEKLLQTMLEMSSSSEKLKKELRETNIAQKLSWENQFEEVYPTLKSI